MEFDPSDSSISSITPGERHSPLLGPTLDLSRIYREYRHSLYETAMPRLADFQPVRPNAVK